MLVLIVDDNRICSQVMAAYFRHRGARVVVAGDGLEGLEVARRDRPDAVVLDIAMPKMGGIEFLETVRRDPVLAGTVVVVTTAAIDETVERRVGEVGVAGYFVKGHCALDEVYGAVAARLGGDARAA